MKIPKALSNLAGLVAKQHDVAAEFAATLTGIRRDIADAKIELDNVQAAPPDDLELRRRAAAVTEILAAQARERLNSALLTASDFDPARFADDISRSSGVVHGETVAGAAGHFTGTSMVNFRVSGLHVMAVTRPDDLTSLFSKEAAASADPALKPLSAAKRAAEIERLRRAIDERERAEEQLCRAAEAGGLAGVERRNDASPRWLLAPDTDLVDDEA